MSGILDPNISMRRVRHHVLCDQFTTKRRCDMSPSSSLPTESHPRMRPSVDHTHNHTWIHLTAAGAWALGGPREAGRPSIDTVATL
jgi:hypothetical protein